MTDEMNVSKEQEARCILRESFLRDINELHDTPCNVISYNKHKLDATFTAWNPNGKEILVQNFTTPTCSQLQSAMLRTGDVIAMEFNKTDL